MKVWRIYKSEALVSDQSHSSCGFKERIYSSSSGSRISQFKVFLKKEIIL